MSAMAAWWSSRTAVLCAGLLALCGASPHTHRFPLTHLPRARRGAYLARVGAAQRAAVERWKTAAGGAEAPINGEENSAKSGAESGAESGAKSGAQDADLPFYW